MILLDTTTRRLRILLGGAGTVPFLACYVGISTSTQAISEEGANPGQTNGATPVDLVTYPGSGVVRQVKLIWVRNTTAGAVDVTIRYDDNGTNRDFTFTLSAGETLQYTDGEGWRCFTAVGKLKVEVGTGGGGSIDVQEVDGAPVVSAPTILEFDQADGFVVSEPVAGTARVKLTAPAATDNDARILAWLLSGD